MAAGLGNAGITVAEVQAALDSMDVIHHPDRGLLDPMRNSLSAAWAIVPKGEMAEFLVSYMDMTSGDLSLHREFTDEAISRNWFDELDGTEQQALFAILNGAGNITPEKKSPGLTESLGFILAQAATVGAAVITRTPPIPAPAPVPGTVS